jgi:glucokinase
MRTGVVIGFDLGGTKMHAAAVDEKGTVLHAERDETLAEEGADPVILRMTDVCTRILKAIGAQPGDLSAVCVGVPGGVNDETGIVDKAPNLGWENVPLASLLGQKLGGTRVFLDNDVRVAVLGEHAYGVGRGTRAMVGIWVGTGIGGGVILDGKLHLGARGAAGELGHMMVDLEGPRCPCGKRGCAEALASRTSIERDVRRAIERGEKSVVLKIMKKKGKDRLTSSVVEKALDAEDRVLTRVLAAAQKNIGILVANVVNLIDPEVVVIGGGIAERLGERFVAPIRETAYKRFLVQRERENVRVVATELKEFAAPMGAAFVARQRLAARAPSPTPVIASA